MQIATQTGTVKVGDKLARSREAGKPYMLPPAPLRPDLRNLINNRGEAASMRRKAKRHKANRAKTKLGLPDLEQAKSAVLVSLRSPESQRSYRRSCSIRHSSGRIEPAKVAL